MSTAKTRGSDRVVTVALLSSIATGGLATAASASVTNNWITWSAPTVYDQTGNYDANGQTSYQYATTATGTLTMPDSTVVYVRLTGEVVSPTAYGGLPTGGGFCGPSGFASNGTTISNFWSQMPVSGTTPGAPDDGSAFLSANVTSLPTNGDHIGLIGATNGGVQTQTIEFFSDAGFTTATTVQNILILAGTVGGAGTQMSWTFDRDFEILSDRSLRRKCGRVGGSARRLPPLRRRFPARALRVSSRLEWLDSHVAVAADRRTHRASPAPPRRRRLRAASSLGARGGVALARCRAPPSPHPLHDLGDALQVAFGVDLVGELGTGMAQRRGGGFQPELPSYPRARGVPQLMRVPGVGLAPRSHRGLALGDDVRRRRERLPARVRDRPAVARP